MKEAHIKQHELKIKSVLRKFVQDKFLAFSGKESFSDSDSFMENGLIDSTGILELIEYIEDEFALIVEDEEIIPDNLDSLLNITNYISGKLHNVGK